MKSEFQHLTGQTEWLSVVDVHEVELAQNVHCAPGGDGFPRHFHEEHFPDRTRPMADKALPIPSSSSTTTTGSVSFAEDPRAFYNKETATWRLEDDDGNELEYDQAKGAWIPLVRNR